MSDCERFAQRLNQRLDQGRALDADPLLRQHAVDCSACCGMLEAWRQIDQAISPAPRRGATVPRAVVHRFLATAAALALCVVWYAQRGDRSPTPPQLPSAPAANRPLPAWSLADGSLADAPWLDQWTTRVTEPLVPITEGVTPLARGFRTALGLLIVPGSGSSTPTETAPSSAQAMMPCFSPVPHHA